MLLLLGQASSGSDQLGLANHNWISHTMPHHADQREQQDSVDNDHSGRTNRIDQIVSYLRANSSQYS